MILVFPDADTFRLALTGGFVPADAALAPAAVSFEPDGRLFLETDAKLSKKTAEELKRLGVLGAKRHHADPQPVSCWPQVVPVEKDAAPPQLSSQAPVLFELPSADALAEFVTEMLRLGNDRQSFRWVVGDDDPNPRVLLRVIGPPYYTLLRALDRPAGTDVRAYVEQAPRVWVEVGHSHPLADQVKPAEGQILLVRSPRDWRFFSDAPFRDVYETLNLTLPSAPAAWHDSPLESKLTVPLKLVPGNATDAPEMWVLRGETSEQLDAFVRDADDRVTQRLKFAVGTDPAGGQVIVLRTTSSKLAPPVLPIAGAVGYKPFWKLPNLYVPAGTRLHPQLRRDVVRKLLADDTDQLVWLAPGPDGTFTPETLPEDSFRPLEDWVDYVIESNHAPLTAWVEATRFGFEGFVCTENPPPKPKDDKGPSKGRKGDKGDGTNAPSPTVPQPADTPKDAAPVTAFMQEAVEVKPPSAWVIRRQELEERFLAVEGPLDSPERQALWPDLAVANAGAGNAMDEAGLCWANALWGQPTPPTAWLETWLRAEFPTLPRPVPAAEFDKRMKPSDPTPGEMRQFAAALLAVAHQTPPPKWLTDRLSAVQQYLETHESKLPVRTAWLAAYRLAQLAGADVLGLARVRDRLLQRLLEEGLNPERNLPVFLRMSGSKDAARIRLVREKARELHRLVRAWAEKGAKASGSVAAQSDGGATLGYIDFMFAVGMAKLGEATTANGLVKSAEDVLTKGKGDDARSIAAGLLIQGFRFRVEQVLDGKPSVGPLPAEMHQAIEKLRPQKPSGGPMTPADLAFYAIIRLQQQSRILEPQERLEPYRQFTAAHQGEIAKTVLDIQTVREPQVLARKIREVYKAAKAQPGTGAQFYVLFNTLPLCARAGEAFTVEMLGLVPEVLTFGKDPGPTPPPTAEHQGLLLTHALVMAGHFDRHDLIGPLIDRFIALVRAKTGDQRYDLINAAAGQSIRSLRRFGLKDEIDKLLRRLQDELLGGQTAVAFRTKLIGKPEWAKAFQSLLGIAGGWLSYGVMVQAAPILDDARDFLLSPAADKLLPKDYTPLAQAYIAAVGQGSAEYGLPRIIELFARMNPERVTNGWTTAPCYSRFHLNIAEEVVLALTSDDFALGPSGRRWLEEDEYLIRRRIHRDMKRHLERSGL